uniref:Uncharacterized protein n=1 Tax=Arundo donax TaxID=35708 RepID=A0A0A9AR65_ARUDO
MSYRVLPEINSGVSHLSTDLHLQHLPMAYAIGI